MAMESDVKVYMDGRYKCEEGEKITATAKATTRCVTIAHSPEEC